MVLDRQHFSASHFELRWPLEIFIRELDRLSSASSKAKTWRNECELLLEDAFQYKEPKEEFDRCTSFSRLWDPGSDDDVNEKDWLAALKQHADALPIRGRGIPYWSQRVRGYNEPERLDLFDTARHMSDLIVDYLSSGYLSEAFGQHCVDNGETIGFLGSDPTGEICRSLGREDLWPISSHWRDYELDDLCDVAELIHDYVSRPMSRYYHSYSGCGWHYSDFRRGIAQELYRAQVNTIFARSSLNLMLNESGRFEETITDELESLIKGSRSDEKSGGRQHDELQYAIASFRQRGASEQQKRQAIVTMAGILEERRASIEGSSKLTGQE